jgi:hypothetical protein
MATVSAQYHGMSIYNMIGEHLAEADHTPALCSNSPPPPPHSVIHAALCPLKGNICPLIAANGDIPN